MNLGTPGPISTRIGVNGLQAVSESSVRRLSSLDRTHPGALSRAASRLVCRGERYYCGSLSCSSNVKGGWLFASATRPNASCLISSLSERPLPPPLRAFPQLAFLHSP